MMRRALFLSVGLALLQSAPASPEGVNLFWNDCNLGPSAARDMSFTCNTNEGSHLLVASFVPSTDLPQFVALEATVDLESESCPMTDWWHYKNIGTCRQTALAVSCTPPSQGSACESVIPEPTIEGFAYRYPWAGYQGARIEMVAARPIEMGRPVFAGTEYYAFRIVIENTNTVGEGACGGCADPVCIALVQLSLIQADGSSQRLDVPDVSSVATWQGVPLCCGSICDPPPPHDCTTRALRNTWGRVKSLYR